MTTIFYWLMAILLAALLPFLASGANSEESASRPRELTYVCPKQIDAQELYRAEVHGFDEAVINIETNGHCAQVERLVSFRLICMLEPRHFGLKRKSAFYVFEGRTRSGTRVYLISLRKTAPAGSRRCKLGRR